MTTTTEHLKRLAEAAGFQKWSGGGMPVPKGTTVDVCYRNGEHHSGVFAGSEYAMRWTHENRPKDIVAYRVCPAAPKKALSTINEVLKK